MSEHKVTIEGARACARGGEELSEDARRVLRALQEAGVPPFGIAEENIEVAMTEAQLHVALLELRCSGLVKARWELTEEGRSHA